MAVTTPDRVPSTYGSSHAGTTPTDWSDPRYQAFAVMRLAFTVAPIAFGLDKFFNEMVHWPKSNCQMLWMTWRENAQAATFSSVV